MKTNIIACRTLEQELRAAAARCGCTYEIRWIPSGLHNIPAQLRGALQESLDACGNCGRVLLAAGFCGNAVAGLRTHGAELIVPKVDDCISLLCGSQERRMNFRDSYFLTEGWLRGERTIWHEYEHTVEKYGEKRAKMIFQTMLHGYRYCAMLDTGCFPFEPVSQEVRRIAQALGLEYCVIEGTTAYLERLLRGPWRPEAFLTVPPYRILTSDMLARPISCGQEGKAVEDLCQ